VCKNKSQHVEGPVYTTEGDRGCGNINLTIGVKEYAGQRRR
jgi:hypothetical protein